LDKFNPLWYDQNMKTSQVKALPSFFKPILWSYDFQKLDPVKDRREIILQAVKYGNLAHWFWLAENYGKDAVKKTVDQTGSSELRPGARVLAQLIFKNDGQRSH